MGVLTGTLMSFQVTMSSSVLNFLSAPAYRASHDHWWALISRRTVFGLAATFSKFQNSWLRSLIVLKNRFPSTTAKMKPERQRAIVTECLELPWSYTAGWLRLCRRHAYPIQTHMMIKRMMLKTWVMFISQ